MPKLCCASAPVVKGALARSQKSRRGRKERLVQRGVACVEVCQRRFAWRLRCVNARLCRATVCERWLVYKPWRVNTGVCKRWSV